MYDFTDPQWIAADRGRRAAKRAQILAAERSEIWNRAGITARLTKNFDVDLVDRRNPEQRSRAVAKMLSNMIADGRFSRPITELGTDTDGEPYTVAPRQVVKASSQCAASPMPDQFRIRKTDATEPYRHLPDPSPTPDARQPAAQQFLPHDDDWNIFGPLLRTETENSQGSVAARNVGYFTAYRQSARTVLPGVTFEPPSHSSHADNRATGWGFGEPEAPATNYGADKFSKRAAGQRSSSECHQLEAEILRITKRQAELRRAGRHDLADDLHDTLGVCLGRLRRLAGAAAA
jgi:hypothetical protein